MGSRAARRAKQEPHGQDTTKLEDKARQVLDGAVVKRPWIRTEKRGERGAIQKRACAPEGPPQISILSTLRPPHYSAAERAAIGPTLRDCYGLN